MDDESVFRFRQFSVRHDKAGLKVGTDGVLLGAWADVDKARDVLDIGTGTGLIALMLAQRNANANIHGVDISKEAYEQANENFTASPWYDRMRCFHMPIQEFAEATVQRYDLIVSNPPYFTDGILSDNAERSSARHAIYLPQEELVQSVILLLRKQGRFCVILPYLEGVRFKEIAQTAGLFCNKLTGVKPTAFKEVSRWMMEFSFNAGSYRYNEIFLRNENGNWSGQYRELTSSYYINL